MKNKKLILFCAITPIVVTIISFLVSALCFFGFMYLYKDSMDNFFHNYIAGTNALSSINFLLGIFLYYIFFNLNDKVRNNKKLSFYVFFINVPTVVIILLLFGGFRVYWWLILIFFIIFILLQTLVYKKFRKLVESSYFDTKTEEL